MKENGVRNKFDNIKDYTHNLKFEHPFLREVDSRLVRTSLYHLDDNFQRFFKSTFGYPKFKSKYGKNSYTTTYIVLIKRRKGKEYRKSNRRGY